MFPFRILLYSLISLSHTCGPQHTHKHTPQRQGLLQDVTDGSNTQAAFKSQEVTEEVLMRVLSVYPVRPSRQPMNNRHCGSILWILNQWHWERALANTYGSPGWAVGSGGVENTKASPSVSLGWKSKPSLLMPLTFVPACFPCRGWQTGCLCSIGDLCRDSPVKVLF